MCVTNILIEKEKEIIDKCNKLTGKKIKTLIFRGSKDGFKSKDFHSKCDGHSNTIVIVKIKNGNIVGGYASVEWESSSPFKYSRDDKSFLFSLTKNKIYKIKEGEERHAIIMDSNCGPIFHDSLFISDNCNVNNESYSNLGSELSIHEINGEKFGKFIGYESSDDYTNFVVDDYEL